MRIYSNRPIWPLPFGTLQNMHFLLTIGVKGMQWDVGDISATFRWAFALSCGGSSPFNPGFGEDVFFS